MKVIKRAGMFSKRLPCYKCGRRRWSGWWLFIFGWQVWKPSCSGCVQKYVQKHPRDDIKTFVERRDR